MRALIDTCIVIDALQSREPFAQDAQKIFLLSANWQYEGFLTAKGMTDIYYLTHRQTHNDKETRTVLSKLCELFYLLDTSSADVQSAIFSDITDFEDGVMIETAMRSGMDCIVTRNIKDYAKAKIPVYSPGTFIEHLMSETEDMLD